MTLNIENVSQWVLIGYRKVVELDSNKQNCFFHNRTKVNLYKDTTIYIMANMVLYVKCIKFHNRMLHLP